MPQCSVEEEESQILVSSRDTAENSEFYLLFPVRFFITENGGGIIRNLLRSADEVVSQWGRKSFRHQLRDEAFLAPGGRGAGAVFGGAGFLGKRAGVR